MFNFLKTIFYLKYSILEKQKNIYIYLSLNLTRFKKIIYNAFFYF